ncbi:Kinesin- protein 12 [Globomyces sp. JEL0801]|nr:Kinesin- protein 12 [Globomyces sp. JEL0801]
MGIFSSPTKELQDDVKNNNVDNPIEKVKKVDDSTSPLIPKSSSSKSLEPVAGQMQVVVRIRPLNKNEKQLRVNSNPAVQANNDSKTLQLYLPDGKISVMSFSRVYGTSTNQNLFYSDSGVSDLINQALNGYATTIFAFGQTGSGKTFTITGPPEETNPDTVGIVPRALAQLFDTINEWKKNGQITDIRIQSSYLEIYNENVLDLLNPFNNGLPVRWNQERGFFVERLFIVDCDNLDDCLAVLEEGLRNRTVGGHNLNEHSSRSHSMLTVYLEIHGIDNVDKKTSQHRFGKLNFVDLAGSERVKQSRATLDTFTEALSINKSLLTLGKCISALSDPQKRKNHIPFRDSKLTKLLADSLGGRGSALMIACISPSHTNIQETLKTLRYSTQALKIQNQPAIQLDPHEEMLLNLKREIQELRKENLKLKGILTKEPQYASVLQEIEAESKSFKSYPGTPKVKTVKLPDIKKQQNRIPSSKPKAKPQKTDVKLPKIGKNDHHTSKTSKPTKEVNSRAVPKKALQQRSKTPMQLRIEEMKKSDAPYGYEKEEKDVWSRSQTPYRHIESKSRSRTPHQPNHKDDLDLTVSHPVSDLKALNVKSNVTQGKSIQGQQSINVGDSKQKPKEMSNFIGKPGNPKENVGGVRNNGKQIRKKGETTPHPTTNRPSGIELNPQLAKDTFSNEKPKGSKENHVIDAVNNRDQTLKDIKNLDAEISRMSKKKKP